MCRARIRAGIVVQVVFILWWLSLPDIAQVNFGPWKPVPIWQTLYLPSLWIAIIVLTQHIVNLLRPRWDWLPSLSALATSIASLLVIYPLRHFHPLLLHADPNPSARAAMQTVKLENMLQIAISWTCIGIAVVIAVEAWKLYRMTRGLLPKAGVLSGKPGVLA